MSTFFFVLGTAAVLRVVRKQPVCRWAAAVVAGIALGCAGGEFLGVLGATSVQAAPPHFEAVAVPGRALEGNPLGDPVERRVAVFTPELPKFSSKLMTCYYLPGFGGSSEDFVGSHGGRFAEVFQQLADQGIPMRMVVVDCRNRWGGSQYINSPAQGNYADYLLEDVIPFLEKKYGTPATPRDRILAGHSSGGFGVLRVALMAPERFGAMVALSPDSDFEVTHRPLAQARVVQEVTPHQLKRYTAPPGQMLLPSNNLVTIMLGLSAAYAAKGPNEPGEFHWLYNEKGQWQEEVWQNWLEEDPVVIARRTPYPFLNYHRVYLDGAEHDEFGAQKGARVLRDVLKSSTKVEFYESPGGHAEHIEERLARGLEWVFGRKPRAVAGR
jgi:pimeloyl-ACP methyl ester carboxylesterase